MQTAIDPTAFVGAIRPFLAAGNAAGLAGLLRSRWTPDGIANLLAFPDADTRKVAALSLALVGGRSAVDPLCHGLSDTDPMVHQMAEHALWSIWFRLGAVPAANDDLCRGARLLADREFARAIGRFDAALSADPAFAEAYNQRAIAHYLRDEYVASIADCRRATALMPCHFGAWAGLGHCHLHLGELDDALVAYRRALSVHPHMPAVREAAAEICRRLRRGPPPVAPSDDSDE